MPHKVPREGATVRSIAFILSAASSVALLTASGGCGSDDIAPGRDAMVDTSVSSLEKKGIDLSESAPLVFQTLGEAGASAGEYLLELELTSRPTSWGEANNESVYLAITAGTRLLAHVPLHQGETKFLYRSLVGTLSAGEAVSLAIASFSRSKGTAPLRVERATLVRIEGDEALLEAPAFVWPREKRFDDLPVALGWSRVKKEYTVVYTHENGGTVTICGGGAKGLQAEIARWGRSLDIETIYRYGTDRGFLRCSGFTDTTDVMFDEKHPRLYYGSGHNRLFENRKGYGVTCGSEKPEKTDGPLAGWGETAANATDEETTVLLRPVPEAMDTFGYAAYSGRREALADRVFPWTYRLSSLEAERESSLSAPLTYPIDQYLYVDLHFRDVDGAGDGICSQVTSGGFVIRTILRDGTVLPGLRVTQSYGSAGDVWKRVAMALPNKIAPADILSFQVEAQETEAFTLEELGRVFLVRPSGPNGALIDALRDDLKPIDLYFDAAKAGCVADEKDDDEGKTLSCIGTSATLTIL